MRAVQFTARMLFLLVLLLNLNSACAQQIYYNGSVQYSSGSYYFTERTGSFVWSNGISINHSAIRLSLNIPYIYQTTPWVTYSGSTSGILPTGGPNNGRVNRSDSGDSGMGAGSGRGQGGKVDPGSADSVSYNQTAVGDPTLNVSVPLIQEPYRKLSLFLDAGLKFPLADPASGYGSGAWDAGAGLTLIYRLDSYLLLASGSYWYLGDMDELPLNEIFSYSLSIGRSFLNGKYLSNAGLYGSTRIIDEVDPPFSFGGGVGMQLSSRLNMNLNFLAGLSESSPDYSIGYGLSFEL